MQKLARRIAQELDQVVAGVFDVMVDARCLPAAAGSAGLPSLCAEVSFREGLEGRCLVSMDRAGAECYLCGLLGPETELDDAACADTVAELCNMIAGGWKSLQPPPAGAAAMTAPSAPLPASDSWPASLVPRIISIRRAYTFCRHTFRVEVDLSTDSFASIAA